ncbi:T9SS type A sorting domain-containing protein [Porphyromonas loveana]|uniref:T9SS type A sorting domain-containing protein n=1 Tax=Porphyromonas loveana TaxID=1884669 RepID=UPI00359FE320
MKKSFRLASAFLLGTLSSFSQVVNVNPNPNGEPWLAGTLPVPTPEMALQLRQLPVFEPSASSLEKFLPPSADNSQHIFMAPVFTQNGESCAQAAGVGYTFTYEINRLRLLNSSIIDNQYPTHYTWNFLNNGNGSGSWMQHGWTIIKENGCPDKITYQNPNNDPRFWMGNYMNYYYANHNKIKKHGQIKIGDEEGLKSLKHWLADHHEGAKTGGLACFAAYYFGLKKGVLASGTPHAGKSIWFKYDSSRVGFHVMTIVGYDDNVRYDVNGDGRYTNDIDINGDGRVDMSDWEIGAVKVVNSWGSTFPTSNDGGYIYMLYSILATTVSYPTLTQDAIYNKQCYVMEALKANEPELMVKATIQHPCRHKLRISLLKEEAFLPSPQYPLYQFFSFSNLGGCFPMNGANNTSLEIGLNFPENFSDDNLKAIRLRINENDPESLYQGNISSVSLIDYRWGEVFEIISENFGTTPIINNSATDIRIPYQLLPHEEPISGSISYEGPVYSRFSPLLASGSSLNLEFRAKLQMYNSHIKVEPGALLTIQNNVTIEAKSGKNEITIEGDLVIGENVTFMSNTEEPLIIRLVNNANSAELQKAKFINCIIHSSLETTSFNDCDFTNTSIYQNERGEFSASSSRFIKSNVIVQRRQQLATTEESLRSNIENCLFDGQGLRKDAILLSGCNNLNITNNTISNYHKNGIALMYCNRRTNQGMNLIRNNIISNNALDNISRGFGGINVYNSVVTITDNKIRNNQNGVLLLNRSVAILSGSDCYTDTNQMQVIEDNTNNQVYASSDCMPYPCRYNYFSGTNNSKWFYLDTPILSGRVDLRYNAWGEGFTPDTHLYPSGYTILPMCNIRGGDSESNGYELFANADQMQAIGSIEEARMLLKSVVETYSNDILAPIALTRLYALEVASGDNWENFYGYLDQSSAISENVSLAENSRYIKALSEICQGNTEQALSQLQGIELFPYSIQDSVFASIDQIYLNASEPINLRKTEESNDIEGIVDAFSNYRDEQLGSLFDSPISITRSIPTLCPTIVLHQSVPNPAEEQVTIPFELKKKGKISIQIIDAYGTPAVSKDLGLLLMGAHSIEINIAHLRSGYYFYSLSIDGTRSEYKKLIVK